VTDGLFSDTETIQVTVNEVNNSAPVLAPIGNRTVDEQVLLAFTATATDADVPATTRTFSLGAGNPLGSAITAGGAFTWTPAETQGGAVYPVTVIVTDNGLPALNDTELIQITVNETNTAPFLNQPANVTVEEGQTATQQLLGADNDFPLATLTYSKVSGPVFLTVSNGGLVTVAPTLGDAGTHSATVQVSDGQASAMRSFSITVIPGEFTPAADAGGPYSGAIGAAVPFDGSGSSDPHGAALTYSWDFGDGTTAGGVNPVHAYAATGSYTVTLTVNNGTLSDTDVTTATIVAFFSTNVFVTGGNKTVRLGSGKPQTCVHIEPEGGAYDASDVDLSSIRMLYGSGVIPAISDKAAVGDDKNQNGVAEITACFSKEDLRVLFAGFRPTTSMWS
jgi:hypothetical protein